MSKPTKKGVVARPRRPSVQRVLPSELVDRLLWLVATTKSCTSEAIGRQIIILLVFPKSSAEKSALRIAELMLKLADPIVDMPREKFEAEWLAGRGKEYAQLALEIFTAVDAYAREQRLKKEKTDAKKAGAK